MSNQPDDIIFLWKQFAERKASKAQVDLLFNYLKETTHDEESLIFLEQQFAEHKVSKRLDEAYLAEKLSEILTTADLKPAANGLPSIHSSLPVHRAHFLKTVWFRYAAIFLTIAATATLLYKVYEKPSQTIVQRPLKNYPDIQPGVNKAILTLADGTTIVLDSAANGALAIQGTTKVLKLNAGSLAYQGEASAGIIGYNTIQTPKGGQYQILLPDGTRVWLNAASSIRFPTAFTSERRVTVNGEAYLEISRDAKRPFTVMTSGGREIRVLGTSFNVNAYQEEPVMKTTLLEGSINVSFDNKSQIVQPGQQAVINNIGAAHTISIKNKVDLQQVLAWKNGAFDFEGAKLPEVMRQIERWYDVTVVYEKGIPDIEFVGKMGRSMPLSGMITAFERMGIHCRIEDGRKLIVTF